MWQETPQPLPVLDYGRPPRGARWRRVMERVMVGLLPVTIFLVQPRLLSLVLLGLFVAPCALGALAMCRRRRYVIVAALVVGVSSFLPFDVAPVSFHFGERIGTS